MDLDLQFAADSMAGNYGSLRDLRQGAVRALRAEVAVGASVHPFAPLATGCHPYSHPATRPWALPGAMSLGFVQGLPAVGLAPFYGIFPQQPALPITLEDVFFDCEAHNSEIRASLKPGLHDDFLLSQSVADAEAGFCTPPLTWSRRLKGSPSD